MRSWSMSIKTPTILRSECWNCWLEKIIALWLVTLSSPSIDSVRPIRRFLMINLNSIRPILVRASWLSSRKISVVTSKCWKRPMMSLNDSWTRKSARLTTMRPTTWLREIQPNGSLIQSIRRSFWFMMVAPIATKRILTKACLVFQLVKSPW